MKIDTEHFNSLHIGAQEVLGKSNEERIEFLNEDKWIPYPAAITILDKLERLLKLPSKLRMPSMLIVGETNNGKSSIIRQFSRKYTPIEHDDAIRYPIVNVIAPSRPDLNAFYGEILYNIMAPYPSSARTAKKEELVRYYFERTGVSMLIVDEIHNILCGTIAKQKEFMNALKNMSNHLQIPIVLVGIKDALRATSTDAQISNRFTPVYLPQWKIDKDYINLLASIETLLPLRKASGLASNKQLALEIYNQTDGYIGEMVNLLYLAAELGIKNGSEQITLKEIKECGYLSQAMGRRIGIN